MADVITSIGSDSSITTGTPSSCSGSSSPYSVTFPSAPSGVSIGDSVSFQDEVTTFATYTYLVTDISSATLTLKFVSESSGYGSEESPCNIMNSSYSQATGTFKRTYSTITAWESDLDNTAIYSSGDDAIGECYKDSNFNEAFTINGGGTVGLDSVKLTAPAGQRHDGTAGSGVVNVYNSGTQSTSIISRQNCTISFMEYHMGSNSINNRAITASTSAYTDIVFSQNIIHNLTGSFPIAIFFDYGNSSSDTRYCHNNLIYAIDDNDDRVKAVLLRGSYPLKVWNNTTYLIRTGRADKDAYSFACNTSSSAMEVKNCLAIMTSSTGSEAFALNYNSDSDYNGSDFSTATGGSNDLTDLTTAVFEDYDGTPPEFALADDSSPIGAGVDLGTTAGVNIDITGRDRSSYSDWSMGAFQPESADVIITADPMISDSTMDGTFAQGFSITSDPMTSVSTMDGTLVLGANVNADPMSSVSTMDGTFVLSGNVTADPMTSVSTMDGTFAQGVNVNADAMTSVSTIDGTFVQGVNVNADAMTSVSTMDGTFAQGVNVTADAMTSVSTMDGSFSQGVIVTADPMTSVSTMDGSFLLGVNVTADPMTSVSTMSGTFVGDVNINADPMTSVSTMSGTFEADISINADPMTSVSTMSGSFTGDVVITATPMISISTMDGQYGDPYEILYIVDATLNPPTSTGSLSTTTSTGVLDAPTITDTSLKN